MNERRIDVYIDGSHLNKQNPKDSRLGCGGVMVDRTGPGMGTVIDSFSLQLLPIYMKMSFGADSPSNPSAELVAVLQALIHFKPHLKAYSKIVFHADYIGVREWMMGKWKVKEPYIIRIKDAILQEISRQGLRDKVEFEWVRGHQSSTTPDAFWNSEADKLARGDKNKV